MDLQALCLAGAPTRPASPDARAASAMGAIDPPPSAGPDPSAPRPSDEPVAHRTRARKGQAAKRPSQPEPPASEPPAPEPPKLVDPPAEQLVPLSKPPLAGAAARARRKACPRLQSRSLVQVEKKRISMKCR